MPVYIARSKRTKMHYFLRLVESDGANDMADDKLPDFINSVISAKGHKQFARSIENSCQLFDVGEETHFKRALTPSQCVMALKQEFEPTEARLLAREMYLYSPTTLRANSSRESPAAELDAYSCDFPSIVEEINNSRTLILVEPVQDWMMFRNSLSLCAVLLALVENPPHGSSILKTAGFIKGEDYTPKTTYFENEAIIPLKFAAAAFYANSETPEEPLALARRGVIDEHQEDFLFKRYFASVPRWSRKDPLELSRRITSKSNRGGVTVSSFPPYCAWHEKLSLGALLQDPRVDDQNVLLCSRLPEGHDEVQVAKAILLDFWNAACNITNADQAPIGIAPDYESLFDPRQYAMSFSFHSLLGKAWNALFFHAGRRLLTCKHCGCAMLAPTKGPKKEYCSESCRIQARS